MVDGHIGGNLGGNLLGFLQGNVTFIMGHMDTVLTLSSRRQSCSHLLEVVMIFNIKKTSNVYR